jgi:hypothetical protein
MRSSKISVVLAALAFVMNAASGSTVYEVLERSGSLVGVSAGGASVGMMTNSFGGIDLAVDANGNYIVTTGSHLMRVTTDGAVSTIAVAAYGSQFLSVAVDAAGNFIVADNMLHPVLRISPDGLSRTVVASYPISNYQELEDAFVRIDSAGNYILVEDNNEDVSLFKITPSGTLTTILAGHNGTLVRRNGGLTFDAAGNYVITDYVDNLLLRVSPSGSSSILPTNAALLSGPGGIMRDPASGDFIIACQQTNSLLDVSSDGSSVRTIYRSLVQPLAVAIAPTAAGVTTGPQVATGVLFDVKAATESTSLGDTAGSPTTISINDSNGQAHTYHSFVIEDSLDSSGNLMGLDHSTFQVALEADGTGSVLSVTMPSGGDSTDVNSGGALQVLIPFGVNVLSVAGTNVNLGTSGTPITGAFTCAFSAVRGQALGAAEGAAYSGFQLPAARVKHFETPGMGV